jgi:ElaB/YqjD/DUF883 family membrane-anchored ribosome-binding protein
VAPGSGNRENRKRKASSSSVSPEKKNSPSKKLKPTGRKRPALTKEKSMAEQDNVEGAAIPPQSEDRAQSGVAHARRAAEEFKSAAGAVADQYRGRAEEVWSDATNRVRTFQDDTEQYVRDNPTKAVFTALGIGFVLGLIFRR